MARIIIRGIPVSAGISIGRALFLNRNRYDRLPRRIISPRRVARELDRLQQAFAATAAQLEEIRGNVPAELREHGLIIDSHIMIVRDPKLSKTAADILDKHAINAEWALEKAVAELGRVFESLDDPYFRERLGDVRIVAGRIMDQLLGGKKDLQSIEGRVVLMAHDLSPADTVELEVTRIMSLVTTLGAKTSHTGILARSLQIPAVVGVSELEEKISDGDLVIVDGFKGKILVDPDDEELAEYEELSDQFHTYQKSIIRFCRLPGETRDGHSLRILANIELFEEVAQVLDNGGEGVGLLRTEYKYMNRRDLPTEDELLEEYSELAAILAPRPLTIRTLDLGADKMISSFGALEETNPTLGLRGHTLLHAPSPAFQDPAPGHSAGCHAGEHPRHVPHDLGTQGAALRQERPVRMPPRAGKGRCRLQPRPARGHHGGAAKRGHGL